MSEDENKPAEKPPEQPEAEKKPWHQPGSNLFAKGNPGYQGKSTKRKASAVLADKLMREGAAGVIKKVIANALAGDGLCLKLVMDRILPLRRGRPLVMDDFPKILEAKDVVAALNFIAQNSTNGTMSFEEAEAASSMVEATRRAIETQDLANRIKALEEGRTIDGTLGSELRRSFDAQPPLHSRYNGNDDADGADG